MGGSADGSLSNGGTKTCLPGQNSDMYDAAELDLPAGIDRPGRYDLPQVTDDDRQDLVRLVRDDDRRPSTLSGVPGSSSRFARRASAKGAASESRAVPRAPWGS